MSSHRCADSRKITRRRRGFSVINAPSEHPVLSHVRAVSVQPIRLSKDDRKIPGILPQQCCNTKQRGGADTSEDLWITVLGNMVRT